MWFGVEREAGDIVRARHGGERRGACVLSDLVDAGEGEEKRV